MTDVSITLKTGTHTSAGLVKIPLGNFGDYINITVQDSAGAAFAITGMTPVLRLYRAGPLRALESDREFDCSIVSGAGGTCRYLIASGDFPAMTDYIARLELETGNTKVNSTQNFILSVV